MLGFSAAVNFLLPTASRSDLERVRELPYGAGANYALQLRGGVVVACFATMGAGVMDLVKLAESGRTLLVHDGGYPYIAVGSALEFRNAFTGIGVEIPNEIADSVSLMLVAWDQS
ncbi:hypothetical protein [Orlajensenia flava]|uniref:hypothetical protein n=1 Tax=Orlajensenia flava TaxID=2565934 RepID=UPI0010A2FA09|nr:hypothetical protein [Glaciibacter flavus]